MASAASTGAGHARLARDSCAAIRSSDLMIGNAAGDGAHDFERVKRGHARTGL